MASDDLGKDIPAPKGPPNDGRLVADVVADWARRHGQPFSLTLTGPAGGTWTAGQRGEQLVLDALDFCWTVGSRQPGRGLLATEVPFLMTTTIITHFHATAQEADTLAELITEGTEPDAHGRRM